jgi:hypothetical protein
MNRLTLDLNQLLANVDLVPWILSISFVILFWVVMVWILFFILGKMR